MRIAYFVWEYPPRMVGGLGTYASDLVERISRRDHEVTVFTLNDGTLKTSETQNGIDIHRPKIVASCKASELIFREELRCWGDHINFFNQIFSYNYLSATKFLNELAQKKKYDLVVVHDWLSAIAGLIIKENCKIPVVFHLHSTEQQRVGGGSATIRDLEKTMVEYADSIITVSYAMKGHLIGLGYPQNKINVVWNGCDTEQYKPEKVNWGLVEELKRRYGIGNDEKIVFFVGRLTWVKGIENLVLGFPLVLKEFPNAKLLILGKGEQHDDLLRLAKRLGIEDKVIIRSEFVSEEERIAHIALSAVCVFPSLAEPFGIVSLEAMCLQKPVVVGASGISGFREQVIPSGEEQTGFHVEGRNPNDIAWGVKEVLRDGERARIMGEKGRARAVEVFNLEKVATETLNVYERVSYCEDHCKICACNKSI